MLPQADILEDAIKLSKKFYEELVLLIERSYDRGHNDGYAEAEGDAGEYDDTIEG